MNIVLSHCGNIVTACPRLRINFVMEKIQSIYWKYRLSIEDLIPDNSIKSEIKTIESDLRAIDWCVYQNKENKEIFSYSEEVKRDLSDKLEYLKSKFHKLLKSEN